MIALLARADQSVVGAAFLAGAVGSAVGGGVGWFGVLLVNVVEVLAYWCGGAGVSQVVVMLVVVGGVSQVMVVLVVVGGLVMCCDDHVCVGALE